MTSTQLLELLSSQDADTIIFHAIADALEEEGEKAKHFRLIPAFRWMAENGKLPHKHVRNELLWYCGLINGKATKAMAIHHGNPPEESTLPAEIYLAILGPGWDRDNIYGVLLYHDYLSCVKELARALAKLSTPEGRAEVLAALS